jgi:hypothetical protein
VRRGRDDACKPLAPSHADACNPLLQAHPTWAQDKHEGRGFPLYACLLFFPPSCSISRRPIWAGARIDNLLVGPGTPQGRNADNHKTTINITIHPHKYHNPSTTNITSITKYHIHQNTYRFISNPSQGAKFTTKVN